jgi:hypothetical protein
MNVPDRHDASSCEVRVGWGLSGQCPGSAVASLGTGNLPVLVGLAAMSFDAYLRGLSDRR